jgi:hypothetical protein
VTPRATFSKSRCDDGAVWSLNLKTAQVVLGFAMACSTFAGSLYAGAKWVIMPIVHDEIARTASEKQAWGEAEHLRLRAEIKDRVTEAGALQNDRYIEILRRLEYLQARVDRLAERK